MIRFNQDAASGSVARCLEAMISKPYNREAIWQCRGYLSYLREELNEKIACLKEENDAAFDEEIFYLEKISKTCYR